jgi:Na+/pantothenate symporter
VGNGNHLRIRPKTTVSFLNLERINMATTVMNKMVSKDQTIGGIIFVVCVIVGILYTIGLFYFGYHDHPSLWTNDPAFPLVAIPVFLAFIAIMGIGAWIGWTMATTPPPKPIEEITSEVEEKKEEEKKEAPPAETTEETVEEKKPERKKKT